VPAGLSRGSAADTLAQPLEGDVSIDLKILTNAAAIMPPNTGVPTARG
jgi:hypothetical protein